MKLLEKLVSSSTVTPICPCCKRAIPSEDINVAKDIAFCRSCNLAHNLSALASGVVVDADVDLSRPPTGSWFRREGDGMVAGATNRSLGMAFGLLFFTLFWNGIVSFFVMQAAASTLGHLGVSLPGWLPAAFAKARSLPLGLTIFLWLFLTPFVAVGLLVFAYFLNCLAGRTELRLQKGQGIIFTGIGSLGFRQRFVASDVREVRNEDRRWRDGDGQSHQTTQIVIDTNNKPLTFGSLLIEQRRRFLAGVLKQELKLS